jgi:hypothetical protein
MQRMILLAVFTLVAVGCARTTVRKDPQACEEGLRFYRSKPYLKVVESADRPGMVVMTIEHLPDFSEEYSIEISAGIGTNQTKVTLNDAGVLTALDANVDSKIAENIQALASLASAVKPTEKVGAPPPTPTANEPIIVPAWQVPNGYYESVISRRPDGHKQMYGWRYIGFMPYAQCPVASTGEYCMDCDSSMMYGMVNVNGVMVFRQLNEIAASPQHLTLIPGSVGAKPPEKKCPNDDDIQQGQLIVVNHIKFLDSMIKATDVEIKSDTECKSFIFSIRTHAELDIGQKLNLQQDIHDAFADQLKKKSKEIEVEFNWQKAT